MEGTIAGVLNLALNRKTENKQQKQLLCELESVKQSLDVVASRFEYESEPDLVEACIYEMQALTARYRYLAKEARRMGLTKNALMSLQKI